MNHKGYNFVVQNQNSVVSNFKYNGQELEESLGANFYEMDLRLYDPAIARWNGIDPVTHHDYSPYSAFDNNPVFFADPSGADAQDSYGADGAALGETQAWGGYTAAAQTYSSNIDGFGAGNWYSNDHPIDVAKNNPGQTHFFNNGVLVGTLTASSKYRFPQGDKFPVFNNFVKNVLPKALNDDNFARTLSDISGYSIDRLREIFTPDDGPTLTVGGTFADGEFPALGNPNADPEEILLGEDFVEGFQNSNLDSNTVDGLINIINAAIIIAHETAHHGDYHNAASARYNAGEEPGYDFEDNYVRNYRIGDQDINTSGLRLYVQDNFTRLKEAFNKQ